MRSELRVEMLRILEELSKGDDARVTVTFGSHDRLTFEAIGLLVEHGALWEESLKVYKITLRGYDYYEALKTPKSYWAKRNWFPVAVLVVTSVVTVSAQLLVVWLG